MLLSCRHVGSPNGEDLSDAMYKEHKPVMMDPAQEDVLRTSQLNNPWLNSSPTRVGQGQGRGREGRVV